MNKNTKIKTCYGGKCKLVFRDTVPQWTLLLKLRYLTCFNVPHLGITPGVNHHNSPTLNIYLT